MPNTEKPKGAINVSPIIHTDPLNSLINDVRKDVPTGLMNKLANMFSPAIGGGKKDPTDTNKDGTKQKVVTEQPNSEYTPDNEYVTPAEKLDPESVRRMYEHLKHESDTLRGEQLALEKEKQRVQARHDELAQKEASVQNTFVKEKSKLTKEQEAWNKRKEHEESKHQTFMHDEQRNLRKQKEEVERHKRQLQQSVNDNIEQMREFESVRQAQASEQQNLQDTLENERQRARQLQLDLERAREAEQEATRLRHLAEQLPHDQPDNASESASTDGERSNQWNGYQSNRGGYHGNRGSRGNSHHGASRGGAHSHLNNRGGNHGHRNGHGSGRSNHNQDSRGGHHNNNRGRHSNRGRSGGHHVPYDDYSDTNSSDPRDEALTQLNRSMTAQIRVLSDMSERTIYASKEAHVQNCTPCDGTDPKKFAIWIEDVKRIVRLSNLSHTYVATHTSRGSLSRYVTELEEENLEWPQMKAMLQERFSAAGNCSMAKQLLSTLKQDDKPMHEYISEFTDLLEQAHSLTPADSASGVMTSFFINGIKNPWVKNPLRNKDASSLQEMFKLALREENKQKIRDQDFGKFDHKPARNNAESVFEISIHELECNAISGKGCYNCGDPGHIAMYCKKPKQCFRCSSDKHFVRDCTEPDPRAAAKQLSTSGAQRPFKHAPRQDSYADKMASILEKLEKLLDSSNKPTHQPREEKSNDQKSNGKDLEGQPQRSNYIKNSNFQGRKPFVQSNRSGQSRVNEVEEDQHFADQNSDQDQHFDQREQDSKN